MNSILSNWKWHSIVLISVKLYLRQHIIITLEQPLGLLVEWYAFLNPQ